MIETSADSVAELEGFYGSLHIAERFLQEIWEKQEFGGVQLRLSDGTLVSVLSPGVWNHQEGPDFKDATVRIGEVTHMGDIELHLYPREWDRHQHGRDPNYRHVILHVTLFDGKRPVSLPEPVQHLTLLPYMQSDLEALLTHYALKQTLAIDPREEPWVNHLLCSAPAPAQVHALLLRKSRLRWDLKVWFARERLRRYGWQQAAHQLCLEVLGYRRNRAPMHAIALEHPLTGSTPDWFPETVFEAHRRDWKLQGNRPANQPFRRLVAYHDLLVEHSNWPDSLMHLMEGLVDVSLNELALEADPEQLQWCRKRLGVYEVLRSVQSELLAGRIGGSRLHTLFCDAFLPLLAAQGARDLFPHWVVWPAGDVPSFLDQVIALAQLQRAKGSVRCNAWMQGMLQLALEQD